MSCSFKPDELKLNVICPWCYSIVHFVNAFSISFDFTLRKREFLRKDSNMRNLLLLSIVNTAINNSFAFCYNLIFSERSFMFCHSSAGFTNSLADFLLLNVIKYARIYIYISVYLFIPSASASQILFLLPCVFNLLEFIILFFILP